MGVSGQQHARPHFNPGKDPVSILQEAGWAPGPVRTGGQSRSHRDSIPGPQIRDIIKDEHFDKLLQGDEKADWDSFKFAVRVFLGNTRAQNY